MSDMSDRKKQRSETVKPADPETLRQNLLDFSRDTGRERPVVFAGRKEEKDAVTGDLESRLRKRMEWERKHALARARVTDARVTDTHVVDASCRDGAKGTEASAEDALPPRPPRWESATWLFQGAPGAGKTALLRNFGEMKIQTPAGEGAARGGVRVHSLHITDMNLLNDMWELQKTIASAWIPGADKAMEAWKMLQAGITLPGATAGRTTRRKVLSWNDVVNKVLGDPDRYSPLMLTVDEVQKVDGAAKFQLEWLHQGNDGLPIIPVLGGLAWAAERLGELDIDISRAGDDRVRLLEELSEDECGEVVDAFFDKPEFGVIASPEEREQWKEWLVEKSDGWAHHLNAGLKALAKVLAREEIGRNVKNINKENEQAVFDEEERIRHQYYDARLGSPRLKGKEILAAKAIRICKKGDLVLFSALAKVVHEASEKAGGAGLIDDMSLPEGMNALQFVNEMLKAGILHEYRPISKITGRSGVKRVKVPIPSFRKFLLDILKDWEGSQSQPQENKSDAPSSDSSDNQVKLSDPGM